MSWGATDSPVPLSPASATSEVAAAVSAGASAAVDAASGAALAPAAGATLGSAVAADAAVGAVDSGSPSVEVSVAVAATSLVAATFGAAAFLTGAFFAAVFFAGAFFTGLDSSGCSSRVRPSRSARRVTMSAYASAKDEDGPFAATPSTPQRSSTSALVIPSSFASSWILIFFAATLRFNLSLSSLPHGCVNQRASGRTSRAPPQRTEFLIAASSLDVSSRVSPRRPHARANARRDNAASRHRSTTRPPAASPSPSTLRHSHAPRPLLAPSATTTPSADLVMRTSSDCGRRCRQPMQLRMGGSEE